MNPLDFSWTEDQYVTVINPTAETYNFKVHNKEYQLGAGKSAKMPGYIAWVYVYGMSVKLVQIDGFFNRWNEEGFRQEYYDKVVSGVDQVVQAVEVEEEPLVQTFEEEPLDETEEGAEPELPTEEPEVPVPKPAPVTGVKPMEAKVNSRGRSASRA